METIKANPSAMASLSIKFKEEEWVNITADYTEEQLVRYVIQRIQQDSTNFKIFVGMLQDTEGMDIIVEKLEQKEREYSY